MERFGLEGTSHLDDTMVDWGQCDTSELCTRYCIEISREQVQSGRLQDSETKTAEIAWVVIGKALSILAELGVRVRA